MCSDKFSAVAQTPSAQWEHMILITEDSHEVLSKRLREKIEVNDEKFPPKPEFDGVDIQTIHEGDGKTFPKQGD